MKISTIEMMCCPFDKQDLQLSIIAQSHENVSEGYFVCSHCNRIYPIIKGVPIMNPDEYREFALEQPVLEKYGAKLTRNFRLDADIKHPDKDLPFDCN